MKAVNTVIIGAGVSGLTFAKYYKQPCQIFEKESKEGGLCRTIMREDYIWDYSGHFFHFNTQEFKNYFEKMIPPYEMIFHKKSTYIYYRNNLIDYPFQANIHQLPKQEFIDCLYDLFNRVEREAYKNFKEMLYGKFGKSISEKFLIPYNEKLYACNLNHLSPGAMGRFFPYVDPEKIIKNMKQSENDSYNNVFSYCKKGASRFIELLVQEVGQEKISLDTEITSIDIEKKIAYTNKEPIKYRYLINTMPLNQFLKVAKLSNRFDDKVLCSNKVLVFNIGFDKKAIKDNIHWIYFPDKSINFYRVGFYSNILRDEKLSIYVEIGFATNDEINVNEQLDITLLNLKRCGIISDHTICAYEAIIINPAYVHINKESSMLVNKLKNYCANKDIYTIGRYGSWTYCSIEDCMVEAKKLAESSVLVKT